MNTSSSYAHRQSHRSATTWSPEGYDGRTHYRAVIVASTSAMAILLTAATFLLAVF